MLKKATLYALLAGALLTGSLRADICDDIHDLGTRWDNLATFIHERPKDQLSRGDQKKAEQEKRNLLPPTRQVARLAAQANKSYQSLGKQLVAIVEELQSLDQKDTWDDDVRVIDKLVATLDEIVKKCDAE